MDATALRRCWRILVSGTIPDGLGRALTILVLAYSLQARAWGDLDAASRRALADAMRPRRTGWESPGQSVGAGEGEDLGPGVASSSGVRASPSTGSDPHRSARSSVPASLRPGTLLTREHGGTLHRVMVLERGFAWNGSTYDSLSQIALAITNTRWNGPRFFGLRSADKVGGRPSSASSAKASRAGRRAQQSAAQEIIP